jgi:hypothetical protein
MIRRHSFSLRILAIVLSIILIFGLILGAVWTKFSSFLYRRINGFDGIGFPVDTGCANVTDRLLKDASESSKAGSAAATTLMTLLPALLTFALLPTANIRDLIYTSPWIAFWTASMTFGLPVPQFSSVSDGNILTAEEVLSSEPNSGQRNTSIRAGSPRVHASTVPVAVTNSTTISSPSISNRDEWWLPTNPTNNQNDDVFCDPLLRRLFLGGNSRMKIGLQCQLVSFIGALLANIFGMGMVLVKFSDIKIIWLCENRSTTALMSWLLLSGIASGCSMTFWNSTCQRPQMILHLTWHPQNYTDSEMQNVSEVTRLTPPNYSQPGMCQSLYKAARMGWWMSSMNLWCAFCMTFHHVILTGLQVS